MSCKYCKYRYTCHGIIIAVISIFAIIVGLCIKHDIGVYKGLCIKHDIGVYKGTCIPADVTYMFEDSVGIDVSEEQITTCYKRQGNYKRSCSDYMNDPHAPAICPNCGVDHMLEAEAMRRYKLYGYGVGSGMIGAYSAWKMSGGTKMFGEF